MSSLYAAKVIEDSVPKAFRHTPNARLTTVELTFPRFILAEINTHRVMSRGSESSRAIPVEKRIERVRENPFVPAAFSANKKGMQAGEALDQAANLQAQKDWLDMCYDTIRGTEKLASNKVHKQWANRPLEPYAWHTAVISSCYWDNWDALRISPHATPEFFEIARLCYEARKASTPRVLKPGEIHGPYIQPDERDLEGDILKMLSTARCARVSYLSQAGIRDHEADIGLYHRLAGPGHMGPFEHVATCGEVGPLPLDFPEDMDIPRKIYNAEKLAGNFSPPWIQHRKEIPNEAVAKRVEEFYDW